MTRVSFFNSFLLGLAIFQSVSCHFQLIYPPTRGFDETKEPTVPCGGFDTASIPRTPFPLTGAFVEIDAGHTSYTYTVNVLLKSDPVTADFTGSKLVPVSEGTRKYPQKTCIALDFSRSKATSGTDATLQIIFNGGDGELYQCTDVTLMDLVPEFNASQCINADGSAIPISTKSSSSANAVTTNESKAASLTTTGLLVSLFALVATILAS